MLPRAVRSWWLRGWVSVAGVAGLGLARQPLLGVLGYELAVIAAVLAAVMSLHLGVSLARLATRIPAPAVVRARAPWRLVLGVWWRAAAVAAVVTAIPAVLAAVHGLWVPTCDWGFGVTAYLRLVTTGAIVFSGVGVALGLATAGLRAWVPHVLGVVVVLAIAAAGLWRFYSEPPVYSYSPLVGYFPGNLYDEDIQLRAAVEWARLEQLAWVVAALCAVAALLDAPSLRPRWRDRRPAALRGGELAAALAALGLAVALHASGGRLGFAVDASDIQAELGGRYETDHFVIYYARTGDLDADIALIAADHELRLAQVADTLGVGPAQLARLGKIHSYYFASTDQKARLFGARDVEMAKPWRREIYLDARSFPHPSLRHELAHVVAGLFGDRWFGVSAADLLGLPLLINPGLVEGLAVAVDWPGRYDDALTPHQKVRALAQLGIEPSLGTVMSIDFMKLSSQRSYTTAGSFVRYLLDTHGAIALQRLYGSGGDFELAYGEPLGTLEDEWKAFLATVPLPDDAAALIQERFRHGGVFERPCPHAVAARHDAAIAALRDADVQRAIGLLRQVCTDSAQDPDARLDLARALTAGTDAQRAEGVAALEELAGDAEHITAALRASALSSLADLAGRRGDLDAARGYLERAAPLPLEDDEARSIEARLLVLRHAGPASEPLVAYFFGDGAQDALALATRATIVEPQLAVGWYLRGLQHVQHDDHPAAVADLTAAIGLGLPGRRFERFAARMLAVSAWRTGARAAVARAADLLDAPGRTETDALLAADWRDRLRRTAGLLP